MGPTRAASEFTKAGLAAPGALAQDLRGCPWLDAQELREGWRRSPKKARFGIWHTICLRSARRRHGAGVNTSTHRIINIHAGMKLPKTKPPFAHRDKRGFTLVELLLVLVILSTLAAIVYPNLAKHGLRARITATRTQIEVFRTALAQFEMENDRYPQGRNGLLELVQRPHDAKNWHGPYLEKGFIPKDRWGHEFIYECPGKHNPESYDLFSMGPDGIAGTPDDITSWEPDPGD
jgi:general secretion pathway protein G